MKIIQSKILGYIESINQRDTKRNRGTLGILCLVHFEAPCRKPNGVSRVKQEPVSSNDASS